MAAQGAHNLLSNIMGLFSAGGIWKAIAITFILLNLKSLPLAWHVCILRLGTNPPICSAERCSSS